MMNDVKTIVCFGDSNTHGYDSSTGGRFAYDERYPGVLQSLLGNGYLVIEEGLCGRTTSFEDQVNEGMSSIPYIQPCLMSHEPIDLLVIMLGTNDTKERFSNTAGNIAQGLRRLVLKAKHMEQCWKDNARILIVVPPAIDPRYINTDIATCMGKGCFEKSEQLAKYFKQVADEEACYYVDLGSIKGVEMAPYDWMHLTKESHSKVAHVLKETIENIFKK